LAENVLLQEQAVLIKPAISKNQKLKTFTIDYPILMTKYEYFLILQNNSGFEVYFLYF